MGFPHKLKLCAFTFENELTWLPCMGTSLQKLVISVPARLGLKSSAACLSKCVCKLERVNRHILVTNSCYVKL